MPSTHWSTIGANNDGASFTYDMDKADDGTAAFFTFLGTKAVGAKAEAEATKKAAAATENFMV
jgi:hypothetical protein